MSRFVLLVHVLSVVFWVGGMAFAQFALGPALAGRLEPRQRLELLAAILQRFLAGVLLAIVLIVASGAWLIVQMGGMASVAPGVHAMIGLGTLMVIVYGVIRWRYYVRLQRAMADGDTPAGASNAATVRRLVGLNLALGVVTMAVAVLAG